MFSIAPNKHDICISIVTRGVFSRSVAVCGLCNKSLNAAHAWNCGKSLHCVAVVLLWFSVMTPHHTEHSHHALYTGASAFTKATWEIEICERNMRNKPKYKGMIVKTNLLKNLPTLLSAFCASVQQQWMCKTAACSANERQIGQILSSQGWVALGNLGHQNRTCGRKGSGVNSVLCWESFSILNADTRM